MPLATSFGDAVAASGSSRRNASALGCTFIAAAAPDDRRHARYGGRPLGGCPLGGCPPELSPALDRLCPRTSGNIQPSKLHARPAACRGSIGGILPTAPRVAK